MKILILKLNVKVVRQVVGIYLLASLFDGVSPSFVSLIGVCLWEGGWGTRLCLMHFCYDCFI